LSEAEEQRRGFLRRVTGFAAMVAAAVSGVPVIGYFLGLRKARVHWVPLGEIDAFAFDETRLVTFDNPLKQPWDGVAARTGVYVRRQQRDPGQPIEHFLVLAVNCAHLGCPVSWFPQSGLFMCPCHGGVYYADGQRASGPPPRGMYHCVWRIENGRLEIQAPHFPTLADTLEEPA
jgi:Rieske Fe-S protein